MHGPVIVAPGWTIRGMFEIRQRVSPVLLWLTTQYPAMKEDRAVDKVVLGCGHCEMKWWSSVPVWCKFSWFIGNEKPTYILSQLHYSVHFCVDVYLLPSR